MNYPLFDFTRLATKIKLWGQELGFAEVGITDTDFTFVNEKFSDWLKQGFHGEMNYLSKHQNLRADATKLLPEVKRIISCRMNYPPPTRKDKDSIAAFALNSDYHVIIRQRLELLANKITKEVGQNKYRVFAGSGPIPEKSIAAKAGLGWIGKNSLLLNAKDGSYFFLGEIYTDLSLPIDHPTKNRCGKCRRCLEICPGNALVAPYVLDARHCISYLTIEYRGIIPIHLRKLIGTQIFGCDSCQTICPWNRFAKASAETKKIFAPQITPPPLSELMMWDEKTFQEKIINTPLKRLDYILWLRNLAIALGNAEFNQQNITALKSRKDHPSPLVREHVEWALKNLNEKYEI
jgi:epoxyqueuosine reductase